MKKMFTLSAVALVAVTAIAGPKARCSKVAGNNAPVKMVHPVQKAAEVLPALHDVKMGAVRGEAKAPAAVAPAFYNLGDGVLTYGLHYMEGQQGMGWYGGAPYLFSHPFSAKFIGSTPDATWSASSNDLTPYVEKGGVLNTSEIMGLGGFYLPVITVGRNRYWFGSPKSTKETDGAIFQGTEREAMGMGVYDAYTGKLYGGVNGGYAFGSSVEGGVASHATIVDLGKVTNLTVESIQAWLITKSVPLSDKGSLYCQLVCEVSKDSVLTYESVLTMADLEETDEGQYCANFTFSEVDEDGFSSEVTPVLTGDVSIIIEDDDPAADYGFVCVADENESHQDAEGYPLLQSKTFFYYSTDDKYYSWYGLDAVISVIGYFNAFCDFASNNNVIEAKIPVEGGLAVSQIDPKDGSAYNDFDLISTFGVEDIFYEAPEWVELSCDDEYYTFDETTGNGDRYLLFFVGAEALPEGVTGRSGDVVLNSNGAIFTFHVTQGEATESAINVVRDDKSNTRVYNLAGQQTVPQGLFVRDNKVFFAK